MVGSILVALQAFESGWWFGQAGYRRRQRAQTRERLLWGRKPATPLPFVDARLRKAAGVPTKTQTRIAGLIVKLVQWAVQTRAFELLVLKSLRQRWPGHRLDAEVKLCR
jgi:hypothetical protein